MLNEPHPLPNPPAVYFPGAEEGWLDWVAGLTSLHRLHLTAALLRLQPEEGLLCLRPLRRTLRVLRLDGCMLLTDTGVPLLAQLRCGGEGQDTGLVTGWPWGSSEGRVGACQGMLVGFCLPTWKLEVCTHLQLSKPTC